MECRRICGTRQEAEEMGEGGGETSETREVG